MKYHHLSREERHHIEVLVATGWSNAAIASFLGRHPSTISREIHRNSDASLVRPYRAKRATRRTRERRIDKGVRSRKIQGELRRLVEQKLRMSWSPEQISGRLCRERGHAVSHETIYQHVIRDAKQKGTLRYCLRFGGYKQHRCKKSKQGARTRLRKNRLGSRPRAANLRLEVGHWERDCMLGTRGNGALLTVIDRRSLFTRIRQVAKVNVENVARATLAALRPHRDQTKTITNDNGNEFQGDESLQQELGAPIYFTDPSSPWQRGTVENANGLLRQYVPKYSNIDQLPSWMPSALELTLNYRPRKVLGYLTPHESFHGERLLLTEGPFVRLGLEFGLAA